MGKCLGYCGEEHDKLYDDMKIPPMDAEACLCLECALIHAEDALEELDLSKATIESFITELCNERKK